MAKVTLDWELLDERWTPGDTLPDAYTYRAKVPGGWLVAIWAGDHHDHAWGGGLTFVPDPTHSWPVDLRTLPPRKAKGKQRRAGRA